MLTTASASRLTSLSRTCSLCPLVVLKTAGSEDLLVWKACGPAALLRQLQKTGGGHTSKQ